MNRRTTLVLLVIFAALLGYALFVQRPKSASTTPTPSVEYLWTLEDDEVIGVRVVDNVNGKSVAFHIDQSGFWTVTEPQPGAADQSQAELNSQQVRNLRVLQRLTETTDLSPFGVLEPAYTLEVTTTGQGTLIAHIGAKAPTGQGYYAVRPGDANPVVLGAPTVEALIGLIDRPPYPEPTPTPTAEGTLTPEPTSLPDPTPTSAP